MNQTHLSDLKFDELSLHDALKAGLADAGYTYCTPIQAEALPVALRGEDVAGQAQTGTGKTAAFLLAVFNQLLTSNPADGGTSSGGKATPRAIIIAPTRELAVQIHQDALLLGKHTELRMALAYGGTDYEKQRQNIFDGIDILVGTPGRLIDYLKQGVYTLDNIEVVVLDEADRMFDLGFIKDMRYMLRRMPPPHERLNMLFSATLSHRVMELAYEHMNDPRTITIESLSTIADNIRETVYYPSNAEKIPLMVGLAQSTGTRPHTGLHQHQARRGEAR
jgi:ATP-dependent RNA helicase RhlB